MKKYNQNNLITPEGTRDLLFEECTARRTLENELMTLFSNNGFSEVITPFVEFCDVFDSSKRYFKPEIMYKFSDARGRLMSIRPDLTLPLIRLAQTRLKNAERPLKLSYNQTVYRANPKEAGRDDEIAQCGVEIIDTSDESSSGLLRLAIKALEIVREKTGSNTLFEIGDCSIFDNLIKKHNIDEDLTEKIRHFVETKDIPALSVPSIPEIFSKLPLMFGGGEILGNYKDDVGEFTENLERIYNELGDDKIAVDLGLTNKHGYYTNILFNGYVEGYGMPILTGGRYEVDGSYSEGFSVNVSAIASLISRGKNAKTNVVRIALTKGRLEKETIKLLEKSGWDVGEFADKGRKLTFFIPDKNVEIVLAKAPDVITYVESGVCDIGITGKDMIEEYGGKYYELFDLGIGKCRFSLIVKKGSDFYKGHSLKTVASKYTNVTRRFFENKGMDTDIKKIEGSVELAPILGLADGIIDIVETGATLRENGLEVIEDVSEISARVIANPVKMKLKKTEIDEIISSLKQ